MLRDEKIAVEEPLELRIANEPIVTIMRSPGDDIDLAHGLLWSEGWVRDPDHILAVAHAPPATLRQAEVGNVLCVELAEPLAAPKRAYTIASSCGVCGKRSIAELEVRARPVRALPGIAAPFVASLPERLRAVQPTFDETGGVHAAGLFCAQTGELLCVREDIGRHNAVDKAIGWAIRASKLPLDFVALCVSGRVGFEIVQKAALAGVPVVVAVSAPTSLAIDVAERFRITLCGFVRHGSFNVYSHRARLLTD